MDRAPACCQITTTSYGQTCGKQSGAQLEVVRRCLAGNCAKQGIKRKTTSGRVTETLLEQVNGRIQRQWRVFWSGNWVDVRDDIIFAPGSRAGYILGEL
jgi:hypothetical protein